MSDLTEIVVGVRGHQGESIVITRDDRREHVLDAMFDDLVLADLRRLEITREGIKMSFAGKPTESVVRERLLQLLGPPRWKVVQE